MPRACASRADSRTDRSSARTGPSWSITTAGAASPNSPYAKGQTTKVASAASIEPGQLVAAGEEEERRGGRGAHDGGERHHRDDGDNGASRPARGAAAPSSARGAAAEAIPAEQSDADHLGGEADDDQHAELRQSLSSPGR